MDSTKSTKTISHRKARSPMQVTLSNQPGRLTSENADTFKMSREPEPDWRYIKSSRLVEGGGSAWSSPTKIAHICYDKGWKQGALFIELAHLDDAGTAEEDADGAYVWRSWRARPKDWDEGRDVPETVEPAWLADAVSDAYEKFLTRRTKSKLGNTFTQEMMGDLGIFLESRLSEQIVSRERQDAIPCTYITSADRSILKRDYRASRDGASLYIKRQRARVSRNEASVAPDYFKEYVSKPASYLDSGPGQTVHILCDVAETEAGITVDASLLLPTDVGDIEAIPDGVVDVMTSQIKKRDIREAVQPAIDAWEYYTKQVQRGLSTYREADLSKCDYQRMDPTYQHHRNHQLDQFVVSYLQGRIGSLIENRDQSKATSDELITKVYSTEGWNAFREGWNRTGMYYSENLSQPNKDTVRMIQTYISDLPELKEAAFEAARARKAERDTMIRNAAAKWERIEAQLAPPPHEDSKKSLLASLLRKLW